MKQLIVEDEIDELKVQLSILETKVEKTIKVVETLIRAIEENDEGALTQAELLIPK